MLNGSENSTSPLLKPYKQTAFGTVMCEPCDIRIITEALTCVDSDHQLTGCVNRSRAELYSEILSPYFYISRSYAS